MKKIKKDLKGVRFGRLLAIKTTRNQEGVLVWECLCDCGETSYVKRNELTRSNRPGTKSCGCLSRERKTTQGGLSRKHIPEYGAWANAKNRCSNSRHAQYRYYGGRGISMSKEWEESFPRFFKDMGPKPSNKHTIERIDNNKGYFKENCKWATFKEQSRNRRGLHLIRFKGMEKCLTDWCLELNLYLPTIERRINKHNWCVTRVFLTPIKSPVIEEVA